MTPTIGVTRRLWRVISPRWAHSPLDGSGAARHGGRWNRPGAPALYLSEQVETAFAEYQQELGVRPGTFVAYDLQGAQLVDLTQPEVCAHLGIDEGDLVAPWKQLAFVDAGTAPGWSIADRLVSEADGLRVPSAQRRGGINIVLWSWNVAGAPTVTFHDPNDDLSRP